MTRSIAIVHPDLGIGGAERLIVDLSLALDKTDRVTVYTNHHDPNHSFPTGNLKIVQYGSFIPRTIFGRFHILLATLKSIYLAVILYFTSKFDIVICDQISTHIPILKLCAKKVVFYCHYPDLKLTTRKSALKQLYRLLFDWMEELTTKMADEIIVNSEFTKSVFKQTFRSIKYEPSVIYPGISLSEYDTKDSVDSSRFFGKRKIVLSINRFERKKNLKLAIECAIKLYDQDKSYLVVVAGGYDHRVAENTEYLQELIEFTAKNNHKSLIWKEDIVIPDDVLVLFVPSFTTKQRSMLLNQAYCLLYTPAEEHFGIVPLEAMYSRVPVIAINSGGPLETIVNGKSGFLVNGDGDSFANAVLKVDPQMGQFGHELVARKFSLDVFMQQINDLLDQSLKRENLEAGSTFMAFWSVIGIISALVFAVLVI